MFSAHRRASPRASLPSPRCFVHDPGAVSLLPAHSCSHWRVADRRALHRRCFGCGAERRRGACGGVCRQPGVRGLSRRRARGVARLAPRPRHGGGDAIDRARRLRRRRPSSTPAWSRPSRGATDRYFVRTDGPDGALHDYEIALHLRRRAAAAVPGRLSRRAAPGARHRLGQPAARPGRPALVPSLPGASTSAPATRCTGPASTQTWNHMCAECHSTNLRKGYRRRTEHRYETTWSEIDVACEACHGPGSRARRLGEAAKDRRAAAAPAARPRRASPRRRRRRRAGRWTPRPASRAATAPPRRDAELETCARCHSRRATARRGLRTGRPLLDTHRPALLDHGLYFADGQIADEVYEYGSFLQSKMHAAGVTCSDCHDPHSLAAARGPERAVRALPPAGALRGADASPPCRRLGRRALRRVPHAASAPTWWSTRAATTACACRAPISRR